MVVSEGVGRGTSAFDLQKRSHCDFFFGGGDVRKRNRSCSNALISEC